MDLSFLYVLGPRSSYGPPCSKPAANQTAPRAGGQHGYRIVRTGGRSVRPVNWGARFRPSLEDRQGRRRTGWIAVRRNVIGGAQLAHIGDDRQRGP